MQDIPWDLIAALGVPALLSAGTCLWCKNTSLQASQQQSLIEAVAVFSGCAALLILGSFPLSGTPLFQLPGAIVMFAALAAVLSIILSWRGQIASSLLYGGSLLGLLLLTHVLSFPWWNRGAEGWLSLIIGSAGGACFGLLLWQATAGKGPRAWCWWALIAGSCAPLFIGLTAVGHAQSLLIIACLIAIAGLLSWLLKIHSFALPNPLVLPLVIGALLGNASIRYVASPEDPAAISWTLRLLPLTYLIAAVFIRLAAHSSNQNNTRGSRLYSALAISVFIAAAAAALFAYSYESADSATEDDASSFYYQ